MSLLQIIYNGLLLLCCTFCYFKGGKTERIAALIALVASLASWAVWIFSGRHWGSTELGVLAIDLAVLLGFLAIALRTDRFWPLWATAMQLIAVATHAATLVNPDIVPRAYSLAQGFWAYPILLMMFGAAWLHVAPRRI